MSGGGRVNEAGKAGVCRGPGGIQTMMKPQTVNHRRQTVRTEHRLCKPEETLSYLDINHQRQDLHIHLLWMSQAGWNCSVLPQINKSLMAHNDDSKSLRQYGLQFTQDSIWEP